jgi:bifunctional non-homologous end joining protein LigD
MLWRVSRPLRSRSKPEGFILPCQPALADRPPSGPGWLHEIKFDGYRVIARKDGEQVRLWARTTSDYSNAFTRIRDAVAALPVDSAVLDGEAIVMRIGRSMRFRRPKIAAGPSRGDPLAYEVMEVGVATRQCATASKSVRRSPETGLPSFVMHAGWT